MKKPTKQKLKIRTTRTTKMKIEEFKAGQAIVFEPRWALEKFKDGIVYKNHITGAEDHPLRYGAIVHFLAEHSPASGHCIVVDYDGKITTMLHPGDFRLATDEEV